MYKSKFSTDEIDELIKAVVSIKNEEECSRFFEDICTINELNSLAQRFHVAKMLKAGNHYTDIVKSTGASSATVSRVNRALTYGADGYNIIIDRLNNEDNKIDE